MTMTDLDLDEDFDPRPPRIAAPRRCLCCGKVFMSRDAGHRRCGTCTRRDAAKWPLVEYSLTVGGIESPF